MVAVAQDHARRAVHVGLAPGGVVAEGIAVRAVAVGFQVRLVDDVQAVLIAERVPAAVVGVVAGAHAVDVVRLHQGDVAEHGADADHGAERGVALVPVDALELDGRAVEQEPAVPHLHGAEAHVHALDLGRVAHVVLQQEQEGVEVRRLGGPGLHARHVDRQLHALLVARVDADVLGARGADARALVVQVGVEFVIGYAVRLAVVVDPGADVQAAGRAAVEELRAGHGVAHVDLGQRQQVDVPQDSGHAPLVLVLQVGAVRQAVDLQREQVGAGLHHVGDVELRAQVRPLGEARLLPVDVDGKGAVHRVKADEDAPVVLRPEGRHGEFAAVEADGRLVRHARRIVGKGIGDVGILVAPIPVHLPDAGHGHLAPVGLPLIIRAVEALRDLLLAPGVPEAPPAVQQLVKAGELPLAQPGAGHVLEGDEVRVRPQPSDLLHGGVLPSGRGVLVFHDKPSPLHCLLLS